EKADLDAALWQPAPDEPAQPAPERPTARITISTKGRAAPPRPPDEAETRDPPARPVAPRAAAPVRKPAPARPPAPATRPPPSSVSPRDRLRQERAQRARRRRARITTIAVIALIAAVVTSLALRHGGRTSPGAGTGTHRASAAKAGFGYPGPYAPVTLNADNS